MASINKFRKITGYERNDDDPVIEFNTTEELLTHDLIKPYSENDNFSHFAMSGSHLMEISDNGFHWWVIGEVKDPSTIELPKWDGGKYLGEDENGKEIVLTKEVISSCGGLLTLKDGRKLKNLKYFK